jgi:uncharacterized protein (UPF0332 family)
MSNSNDVIQLKMLKANAFMNEASVLIENKFYATVINRLYYSCYHATKALLLTKNLIPKTHSGVVTMLHKHFVLPGEFDMQHAGFYSILLQKRMEEDYGDFIIEDEESVRLLIAPSQQYLLYIEALISDYLAKYG